MTGFPVARLACPTAPWASPRFRSDRGSVGQPWASPQRPWASPRRPWASPRRPWASPRQPWAGPRRSWDRLPSWYTSRGLPLVAIARGCSRYTCNKRCLEKADNGPINKISEHLLNHSFQTPKIHSRRRNSFQNSFQNSFRLRRKEFGRNFGMNFCVWNEFSASGRNVFVNVR